MSETEDERKAREEAAKKDAERDARMDRMDAMLTKMDAHFEAERVKKDAEEDRAKKDAACLADARKDRFGARRDGESYKDWKKRHDGDEMAMMDALEKGGIARDNAEKLIKDCRADAEEGEKKEGGESFEKWAKEEAKEEAHAADQAKKDAEEKESQDRKDSQAKNADLQARLARAEALLTGLTTEVPASERDALAKAQARADSVCAMFGDRAPMPMAGEASLAYRKRLLNRLKPHSAKFKDSRFDSADTAMIEPVEDIIYADAVTAAKAPATARAGLLMPIERRDMAGRTITEYAGDPMAWMQHFMPAGPQGRFIRHPNKGA